MEGLGPAYGETIGRVATRTCRKPLPCLASGPLSLNRSRGPFFFFSCLCTVSTPYPSPRLACEHSHLPTWYLAILGATSRQLEPHGASGNRVIVFWIPWTLTGHKKFICSCTFRCEAGSFSPVSPLRFEDSSHLSLISRGLWDRDTPCCWTSLST